MLFESHKIGKSLKQTLSGVMMDSLYGLLRLFFSRKPAMNSASIVLTHFGTLTKKVVELHLLLLLSKSSFVCIYKSKQRIVTDQ